MVLGALSFLVLALMMTLSFNLSHALREKVSLQQHSDVLAYSMAVMEARALNYYAVSNRAIAASYVAMNSMHAYMVAASVTGEMMGSAQQNFGLIAAQEAALCSSGDLSHCKDAAEAGKIAKKYGEAKDKYRNKTRQLEGPFRDAMRGLDRMVDDLHASQKSVHERTLASVRNGLANNLGGLRQRNAPGASGLPEAVGQLNANEFNCAIDGLDCQGSVPNSSDKARARVMTEVANASRPPWAASRTRVPRYLHPRFLQELMTDIPGEGAHLVLPHRHEGTSKTVQQRQALHGPGQTGGNQGVVISADQQGAISNLWRHGIAPANGYSASIWSDRQGGGHLPREAHGGRHEFEGVNTTTLRLCASRGNCFMKFRANPDARRDWGQPRVYSYLTARLRVGNPDKAPWELNPAATVTFDNGPAGSGELVLAPREGAALSKALVYYHRLGEQGWREAPNMFNPYWRAKLHPFTPEQAGEVLDKAGNAPAARMARTPGVSL
jgi:hypothetical protein